MFSPLPPQPNGIADYSFELLTGLTRRFNCTVVVEDRAEKAAALANVTVISENDYIRREAQFRQMLHCYQVGNNSDHIYMLPYITERPGLLVLHDPSLHHLASCASADIGDFTRYSSALEAEHGSAGRVLGEQFRHFGLRETAMFYDMPMIRGIVGPSLGTIVHSRYAEAKVLARVPDATVTVVPHHYLPPDWSKIETASSIRQAYGLEKEDILFTSLGFVTKSKRLDLALRALAAIRHLIPPFRYVIAGQLRPAEIDIPVLIRELGLADCVTTAGYLEERDLFALVGAADIVINLRHPIGGETSGTMIRALGAGACVVVVDRGPFAEIPDGAAVRIPWDRGFPQRLADTLLSLANDRDRRDCIGLKASQAMATNNSILATVRGYQQAAELATTRPSHGWSSDIAWKFLSPQELARMNKRAESADGNLLLPNRFIAGIMPVYTLGFRALWIGEAQEASLLEHLGYPHGSVEFSSSLDEVVLAVRSPRNFDWILLRIEGQLGDPGVLDKRLAALNRLLAFGGLLILHSVLNHTEDQPTSIRSIRSAVSRITAGYGFSLDAYVTDGVPGVFDPAEALVAASPQEQRCWRLSKISETFSGEPSQHNSADLMPMDNRQSR